MPAQPQIIIEDFVFDANEQSLILEALYFFESQKTFESEDDYTEWRNVLAKVTDLLRQTTEQE